MPYFKPIAQCLSCMIYAQKIFIFPFLFNIEYEKSFYRTEYNMKWRMGFFYSNPFLSYSFTPPHPKTFIFSNAVFPDLEKT